jgi:AbrB family looped-hinge helix DNA binding protein
MKISSKRQVAIPKEVMEALKLEPGDEVEFHVKGEAAVLVPIKTIKVPRDQVWFWTSDWQKKENEADQDLASGRFHDFDSLDDLLKDLHREN